MKYAQIRKYDVANGTGIRTTIFVSGCTHNCRNCFNKLYQDFNYGNIWSDKETLKIIEYLKEDMISGLSVLGGEPFQNAEDLTEILKRIKKEISKDIWIWSGYTFEEILKDTKKIELLNQCDILVDGRFIEELKDLKLKFRGSSNQRLIDVKKSLEKKHIIQLEL